MEDLLQAAFDLLEDYGFTVRWETGDPTLVTALGSMDQETTSFMYCHAPKEPRVLVMHIVLPFRVPLARRAVVRDLLREINAELDTVRFELDERKGTLRCQSAARIGMGKLAELQVDRLVANCLYMAERYQSAICRRALPIEPLTGLTTPYELALN